MLRLAITLGLLSLIGPLAIDMYLAALPDIAREFGADEAAVQATLIGYFLAFGLAQLIYGPLADAVGRKPPLFVGLAVFFVGSIWAAMAPTLPALVAARVVQGMGAASLMVVPRAVVRDNYTGHEATRLMSMLMLVISISPLFAPLAGSIVLQFGDWRTIFATLAGLACLSLLTALFLMQESLPRQRRHPIRPRQLARDARRLLTDRFFVATTLTGGFGMASFFVFIASASFVYTQTFGLTGTGFSIAFAINATGFFGASQFASSIGSRIGMGRMVRLAATGFMGFTLILLAIALAGWATLPVITIGLVLANACLGLVVPCSMVMALDPNGDVAGLASSLGGTLQMVAGGAMIALTGPFFDGTPLPMIAAIAVCGVISCSLAQITSRRYEAVA